jgi:hypothetical protein
MKRLFVILTFMMLKLMVSAQGATDTVKVVRMIDDVASFKLFPTANMWTFLKLDTRNGKIWQVQWSVENDKRFETGLSLRSLIWKDEEINGRFVLYPTTNNYNFIMLDQVNGKTYQVQWSFEDNQRFVIPIE